MATADNQSSLHWASILVVVLCSFAFIGCAAPGRYADHLTIAGADYNRTFDAAVEVARQEAFVGGLRDRRTGVIETEPAIAPTMLEPWYAHRESCEQIVQSTISLQRRRARFEFIPVVDDAASASDVMAYEGDLQLRVFVFVDRRHTVGRRRSTWTRRAVSAEEIWEIEAGPIIGGHWEPIGRDTAMEGRLMAKLQAALNR